MLHLDNESPNSSFEIPYSSINLPSFCSIHESPAESDTATTTNQAECEKIKHTSSKHESISESEKTSTSEQAESKKSSTLDQAACEKNSTTDQPESDKIKQSCQSSSNIIVQTCNNTDGRQWDKKQCCPYCMSLYPKLPRHLEQKHSTELEVASILALPKGSRKRKIMWSLLKNKGNYAHNTNIIKCGLGTIIPYRRPSMEGNADSSDYLPCNKCLSFFYKKDLWKHAKKCPGVNKSEADESIQRHSHQQASNALLPVNDNVVRTFKEKILNSMASDKVSLVARQDFLIVTFGQKMFAKQGHLTHQYQYIRQKLRELGRFLLQARTEDPAIKTLQDCIDPTKFQLVVRCVKKVAGYQEEGKFETPSLALKLGHSLKKCALYMKTEALQTENAVLKEKAQNFYDLMDVEWGSNVSSQALNTLHEKKYNKPKSIPIAEDVKMLNIYLQKSASEISKSLVQTPDEKSWRLLNEITLAQVTLFNRRRGGEMQRITTENYQLGITNSSEGLMQEEIKESLSSLEKEIAKHIKRVEIRGKRGRKVAVLITEKLQNQIDLLLKTRDTGKIDTDNIYLFPRPGHSVTPLRSSDVLRKFANDCGAQRPEWLTSTSLRKHIAVVTQLLNLKEHELDCVAGFMGHDIKIHREFYRLPEDTMELVKVSKLLINMDKGDISKWKGKSLEEIEVAFDGNYMFTFIHNFDIILYFNVY